MTWGARGGTSPRRPDQVITPPVGSVVPGSQSATFRGHILTIYATAQGLFVYETNLGPPVLGNPPVMAIVSPGVTTDPVGNPLPAGSSSVMYVGGIGATPSYMTWDNEGAQYMVDAAGHVRLVMDALDHLIAVYDQIVDFGQSHVPGISVAPVAGTTAGGFNMPAGQAMIRLPFLVYSTTPALGVLIGSWSPTAQSDRFGNTVPAGLFAPQGMANISGIHAGTTATAETWQTLSLAAGPAWTATYARYAVMPFGVTSGMVWVNAQLTSGTTTADGTIIATVPAAYAPAANTQGIDMASNDEPPNGGQTQHLEIDTSGNIRCYGVAATGKTYWINTAYPRD